MVNRNDDLITATIVSGQIVYAAGEFASCFGTDLHTGQFLQAVDDRGASARRRAGTRG
jgi:N-acyl-D-aspartate/D-glutamate deacylase